MEPAELRIETLTGDGLAVRLDDVARLRIAVFREFPYLYDGSAAYERRYLQTYAAAQDGVIVVALDGARVVGAATGMPLAAAADAIQAPFRAAGRDVAPVFYFGESVLLADYRGRGVGVAFMERREAHARTLGRFAQLAFCAVERPADHPLRPAGYVPLDAFWRKRGFRPEPGLACSLSWQDLDQPAETPKRLRFWVKDIAP